MNNGNDSARRPERVSEHRRAEMLASLQAEVTATHARRQRHRRLAVAAMALLVMAAAAWWTRPGSPTAPVAGAPDRSPPRIAQPATGAIVNNRPDLARRVIVGSRQVDTSALRFEHISDDQLMAMLDTDNPPVQVARIDSRMVVISGAPMPGSKNGAPLRAPPN